MWDKKDQTARPNETPGSSYTPVTAEPVRTSVATAPRSNGAASIGSSIQIKGELQGDEDLTIDGRVEGKIDLRDHNLTIGPNGKIKADLFARHIVIAGDVSGNAHAAERVEIAPSGRLTGDIVSPRITIADGAHFKGSVDMEQKAASHKPAAREASGSLGVAAARDDAKPQPRL
ncbi:MAG TPA: polymer-forming cytoskeletal protein [Verrucomicrobiae bacterium]|nr:polymer-forming cytoskeletal protein [Verrucomicrobiae bacterium]